MEYIDMSPQDMVINEDMPYELRREQFLNDVILHEIRGYESTGGYVNDPNDKGGETKFGISKRQYPNLDIKNLSQMQAMMIYNNDFLKNAEANYGKGNIAFKMSDIQINTGNSTLIMQQALNDIIINNNMNVSGGVIAEDDLMGNETRSAYKKVLNAVGPDVIMNKLIFKQKRYYDNIVEQDSTQAIFRDGWEERANYRP